MSLNEALLELQSQLKDLQVANEDLRIQNKALASTATSLAREQLRYKQLFDSAPLAYLTTKSDGKIIEANLAACQLLNVSQELIQGKLLPSLIPVPDRKSFKAHLLSLKTLDAEIEAIINLQTHQDAEVIPVRVSAAPLVIVGNTTKDIRWILRPAEPTTSSTSNEAELARTTVHHVSPARQENQLEVLQRYAQAHSQMWEFKEAPALMEYLSQKAAELVGNYCFLSVLSADGKQLVPVAAGTRGRMSEAVLTQFKQAKAQPVSNNIAEKVLKTQAPCLIGPVVDADLDMEQVIFKQGAVNMLLVPIRTGESSIGLLTLMRDQNDPIYNKQDLTLLQNLADYAGVVLFNHTLRRTALDNGGALTEHGAFMFAVCTDMQGPMHAIAGYAGMLQEQALELSLGDMKEDAHQISKAAEQVNRLLTQLFEMSRIESGASTFRIERVTASDLVNDVETEVRRVLGQPEFFIEREDDLNLVNIKVDPAWARQAVVKAAAVTHGTNTIVRGCCVCKDQYLWFIIESKDSRDGLNQLDKPVCETADLTPQPNIYCVNDSADQTTRLGIMLAQRICRLLNAEFKYESKSETDGVIHVGFSLLN